MGNVWRLHCGNINNSIVLQLSSVECIHSHAHTLHRKRVRCLNLFNEQNAWMSHIELHICNLTIIPCTRTHRFSSFFFSSFFRSIASTYNNIELYFSILFLFFSFFFYVLCLLPIRLILYLTALWLRKIKKKHPLHNTCLSASAHAHSPHCMSNDTLINYDFYEAKYKRSSAKQRPRKTLFFLWITQSILFIYHILTVSLTINQKKSRQQQQ